jgi:pimeloyl-ACP methyl ester carboxylesterase
MTSAGMGVVSLGAGARLFAPPPGAGLTDRNSPAEVSPHGIPYGSRSPPPASSASIVTVLPMERQMNDVLLHYFEHGDGVPLLALHGAGVDHREIAAAIEAIVPRAGYRRIYPDLPGMGRSTTGGLTCNNEVVTLLSDFIEQLGEGPVMLLGHSYGAYLARGIAAQRPDLLLGLALVCPVDERAGNLPDHEVVRQDADAYGELEPAQRAGFDDYFVVRTAATARRYRDDVVPGTTLVDNAALGRIFAGWTVEVGSGTFSAPTLIAAGRRDSVVGYTDAMALLERYPHATLGVVEDAGHALMHERPELLAAFLGDWLDRARPNDK